MEVITHRRRGGALATLGASALLAACGGSGSSPSSPTAAAIATPSPTVGGAPASPTASPSPAAVGPLVQRASDLTADLHTKPIGIPLRFKAPTIGVDIPMDAVGLDRSNAMDAPGVGQERASSPDDPLWNTGFWYRGGVEPGQPGTATIAAHLDDSLGRPAAFWNLKKLVVGDVFEVDDQRNGGVVRFKVTETHIYSLAESSSKNVLIKLFGPESAQGQRPQFPGDGIARISLVTCAGSFTRGEYDHRYMVFAERVDGPGSTSTPATPSPAPTSAATSSGTTSG